MVTGQCQIGHSERPESTEWSRYADLDAQAQESMAQMVAERMGFSREQAVCGWWPHPNGIVDVLTKMSDREVEGVKSVYLFGDVGAGKTVLLACMAKNLFRTWAMGTSCRPEVLIPAFLRNVLYLEHSTLIEMAHDFELDRFSFSLLDVTQVPYLILDDYRRSPESERAIGAFDSLINYRERYGMPTWIASNKDPRSLKADRAIARTYSRLANSRWMMALTIKGNLRNPKRAK